MTEVISPTLVFKPGLNISYSILTLLNPSILNAPPMHKSGYVIMNYDSPAVQTYITHNCLFDSGAQSDNYISQDYVNSYIDIFKEYIIDHKSTVRLGDSLITVDITQIITLNVSFFDNAAVTHYATLNFSIMHMKTIEMIIGISSILYSFYDLFLDMLKTARNLLLKNNIE
jgi:hypothetical protein